MVKKSSKKTKSRKATKGSAGVASQLPTWQPQRIYLYYLKPIDTTHADVVAFVKDFDAPIEDTKVNSLILDMVIEARLKNHGKLVAVGYHVASVPWIRLSYVAIVVDDARYVLKAQNIEFFGSEHTLRHKREISSTDSKISGVAFLNYVEKRRGHWNKREKVTEDYKLYMTFTRTSPAAAKSKTLLDIVTHEDSGTNMGPPLPPP